MRLARRFRNDGAIVKAGAGSARTPKRNGRLGEIAIKTNVGRRVFRGRLLGVLL